MSEPKIYTDAELQELTDLYLEYLKCTDRTAALKKEWEDSLFARTDVALKIEAKFGRGPFLINGKRWRLQDKKPHMWFMGCKLRKDEVGYKYTTSFRDKPKDKVKTNTAEKIDADK